MAAAQRTAWRPVAPASPPGLVASTLAARAAPPGPLDALAPEAMDSHDDASREPARAIQLLAGTQVAARRGEVAVEDLRVGEGLLSRAGGYRPLRWVGHRELHDLDVLDAPWLWPVRIRAGSLSPGVPVRDTAVAPAQRLVLSGHAASIHYDEALVEVAAQDLAGRPGIERGAPGRQACVDLLLDEGCTVLVDGLWLAPPRPGRSPRVIAPRPRDEERVAAIEPPWYASRARRLWPAGVRIRG